jgi:hypothetical protein
MFKFVPSVELVREIVKKAISFDSVKELSLENLKLNAPKSKK